MSEKKTKLIEVSEKEYKQLMEICHELTTQDNRGTTDPIWTIFDLQKVSTSSNYSEKFYWYDSVNHGELTEGEVKALLKDKKDEFTMEYRKLEKESKEFFPNKVECQTRVMERMGFDKVFYIEAATRPKGIFFTEKACKAWQRQNKHHLSDRAYDFVDSLWRNPEMQLIRKILLTIKKRVKNFTSVKEDEKSSED